jgi:hypothetical protein
MKGKRTKALKEMKRRGTEKICDLHKQQAFIWEERSERDPWLSVAF